MWSGRVKVQVVQGGLDSVQAQACWETIWLVGLGGVFGGPYWGSACLRNGRRVAGGPGG